MVQGLHTQGSRLQVSEGRLSSSSLVLALPTTCELRISFEISMLATAISIADTDQIECDANVTQFADNEHPVHVRYVKLSILLFGKNISYDASFLFLILDGFATGVVLPYAEVQYANPHRVDRLPLLQFHGCLSSQYIFFSPSIWMRAYQADVEMTFDCF